LPWDDHVRILGDEKVAMSTGKMPMALPEMLTPKQSRAARVLLGINQKELAVRASLATRTVMDFESGARSPNRATKRAIAVALESAGVVLLESEGVALR
jgi:DNA-binding transcriptional regulator YiaG